MATAWRLSTDAAIDWREWGDEFVVRTADQAETHLLSAAAGNVLLALLDAERPSLDIDALFALAFAEPGTEAKGAAPSGEERAAMGVILAELERLGIATRSAA